MRFALLALVAGFTPDPHVTRLTAGGGTEVTVSGCNGTVANAPDIDLNWEGNGSTLYIYATSGDDTTLLVNLPNGNWSCDDDSLGDLNPLVIVRNAPSGMYNIWSGTFGSDTTSARVMISEIDPR